MTTNELKKAIKEKKAEISAKEQEIKRKQAEMDNYEVEVDEAAYEEILNECHAEVKVCGFTYPAGYILKEIDPIAFQTGKNAYADSMDKKDDEGYQELQDALEELESELEDLETDLDELECELEAEDDE